MKRFITSLILAILIITLFPLAPSYSATFLEINTGLANAENKMNAAHAMAEAARNLGYEEQHQVIELAQDEYGKAEQEYLYYLKLKEQKESEYPEASYIWNYLKDLGYSDEVTAGILGNMMVEVGGNTLSLQPTASNDYYYGICQWSKTYSDVWEKDLEYQCDYLAKNIEYELNTFGYAYANGFDYKDFILLTDERKAAECFAVCYERCNSKSNKARMKCAQEALKYFTE